MKKLIPVGIVGILVLSGLGAAAIGHTTPQPLMKTDTITFAHPCIQTNDHTSFVTMENTNAWLRHTNMPFLPMQVTTYTFPFGTTVHAVDVTFSAPQSYHLEQKIACAPAPVAYVGGTVVTANDQEQSLGAYYPETLYDYHMGAGISGEDHVLFLTIRCFPVQYHTADNSILYRDTARISITYDLPPARAPTPTETYRLVVITPQKFASFLQPLVDFKISKGISTKLVTWGNITDSVYFPVQGRDCAEKLKYFIKNAFDQWLTTYVLLVGGRYGGIIKEKWWIPVRYTNLDDGGNWEGGTLSDLYFADLYNVNGSFSSWDSNGNGVFAEWNKNGKDILDMYPEIHIGRLPCKNTKEVSTIVNKIITYENTTATDDWFKRMVVVGGDSAPAASDPSYEGEDENKLALTYMDGFEGVKLWTSTGTLTGPEDVITAVSEGCGFLFFDGHGNPTTWSTHPPKNESAWITGLSVDGMPQLSNGGKLPVCVCGGCHNGQFNTSIFNIIRGILTEGLHYFSWNLTNYGKFWLREWIPACWAWKLMTVPIGGSIATMAYTGLDYFGVDDENHDSIPDSTQFFSGYANTQFFKNYGVNGMHVLGDAHTQALIDYLHVYPPMSDKIDCKTVQEFALIGDPSLQIGGYS